MNITDSDIIAYDIETLKGMFLYVGYSPLEEKWHIFEISKRKNDLYAFIKFLEDNKDKYFVGFNNVKFDSQVVEYISRAFKRWAELSPLEIIHKIYVKSQDIIYDINNDGFPPYREEDLAFSQVDTFQINHYSNPARRCSLKWAEFMMNVPNIEEMPIHHSREDLDNLELDDIISYCKNDVISTLSHYRYTRGQVDHEFYKGKDKIQDRIDLMAAYPEFDKTAINFSDVKVGDEINKKGYLALSKIAPKELYTLKRNRPPTPKFTFGDGIPKYVKFKTPEFQRFYDTIKDVRVSLNGTKQEFPFSYKGTKYTIARGGIHSCEKNVIIKPLNNELLISFDVGSQYPSAIIKRKLYPSHLGKLWLVNYEKQVRERLENKRLSKDESISESQRRIYTSKEKTGKLSVNGAFGKTSDPNSWQYDPKVTFYCTIGNQFEILMLIEELELNNIHVVSANTDGCEVLFDKSLEDVFYDICHRWEQIVGNTEIGRLEFESYKMFAKESVNHYVAITTEGKMKIKGRFDVYVELHKNNTDKIGRIERLAIQKYFKDSIPLEDTIKGCTDIYMFCMGLKASRDYHYETLDTTTYEKKVYQRIVRYICTTKGVRLMKIKNDGSDAPGADVTKINDNHPVAVYNNMWFPDNFSEYNIDYNFYISRAKEIVEKIERGGKRKGKAVPKEQLSLF